MTTVTTSSRPAGLPCTDYAERLLATNELLAARWHRAVARERTLDIHQRGVSEGMRIGWAQAIASNLGVEFGAVVRALQSGEL
jgi:hypothetical protein